MALFSSCRPAAGPVSGPDLSSGPEGMTVGIEAECVADGRAGRGFGGERGGPGAQGMAPFPSGAPPLLPGAPDGGDERRSTRQRRVEKALVVFNFQLTQLCGVAALTQVAPPSLHSLPALPHPMGRPLVLGQAPAKLPAR